ncbi:MAG: twin-arginine translocation signal domain-containing protein, partial [Acidobacteriaceae bacterium]|nr:twin-arginine translocation signal domain-containing protein [Acidobacteriaceae bacterium]
MQNELQKTGRREFLKTGAAVAAGLAAGSSRKILGAND